MLSDIFGKTIKIEVIDFLTLNFGNWYNLTELSACTKIAKEELYEILPELIFNGLVEYEITNHCTTYTLSKKFVSYINGLVFANGFKVASSDEESLEIEFIKTIIGEIPTEEPISYYTGDEFNE